MIKLSSVKTLLLQRFVVPATQSCKKSFFYMIKLQEQRNVVIKEF